MESAPSGVSASLKADKANRESLAKQKSAAKANLDNVLLELEEVQQMKEEAEELEDNELLQELSETEKRLQEQKQEYAAEYARLLEASQAAAEALRQRLRRMTSDRNKTPSASAAEQSTASTAPFQQAAPVTPVSMPQPDTFNSQTSAGTAGHVPQSSTFGEGSAGTAGYVPQSDSFAQSSAGTAGSGGLRSSWSNTRLSDSWGSSAPAAAATAASASEYTNAPHKTSSLASSGFGLEHDTAVSAEPEPFSDARLVQAEQPIAQHADHSTQSVQSTLGRPPKAASNFQPSSFADQQPSGRRQSVDTVASQSGVLPNQIGRKASLMSAGSGYQADSDSNSDTQIEPSTAARLSNTSQAAPRDHVASATGSSQQAELAQPRATVEKAPSGTTAAADSAEVDTTAEVSQADKQSESPSFFGRASELVSNTVWGAAHPIQAVEAVASIVTGHPAEEADNKSAATAGSQATTAGSQAMTKGHHASSSPSFTESAHAQSEHQTSTTGVGDAAALATAPAAAPEPLRAESGYESDVDQPGTAVADAPAVPPAEDRHQGAPGTAFPSTPKAIKTSRSEDEADLGQGLSSAGVEDPPAHPYQMESSSLADSAATAPDSAHSKRSIGGLGLDQPGSASKRFRHHGDSPSSSLTQGFEGSRAEPASPGTISARQFFTNPSSKDGVGGFTQGVAPSLGRTSTSSITSNDQASGFSSRSTFAHRPTSSGGADSFPLPDPTYPSATHSAFEPVPAASEPASSAVLSYKAGSKGLGESQQPPQQNPTSIQASQGSIDTSAGFGGSAGSTGLMSGSSATLSPEGTYRATASAQDVPESAAELVQGSWNGSGAPYGTDPAPSSAAVETVPVDPTLSSLPPSASWGSAPTPAQPPVHASPSGSAIDGQQARGTQAGLLNAADNQPASFAQGADLTSAGLTDHHGSYGIRQNQRAELSDVPSFSEGMSELPSQPQGRFNVPSAPHGQGQQPIGSEAQFQPLRQGATQPGISSEEEQFQPLTQGASQLSAGSEDQFQQGSSVLPQGSSGSGFSQDEQLPLGYEGQPPQQGRAGWGSHDGAHRPLHRQLSAQAESLLRQSSIMTDGGASVKGSPRRRPPPPPPGGNEGGPLGRTASVSQPNTPAAAYSPSDTFQSAFTSNPDSLGIPSTQVHDTVRSTPSAFAESALPESAFAKQQQPLPGSRAESHRPGQHDSASSGLKQPAEHEETEAVRKLREAGRQPLPHSAFKADHKPEPTSFAIPPADVTDQLVSSPKANVTEQALQLPGGSAQQQQSLDFTDLNPLSPKTQQQPGSAKSQAAAQETSFVDSTPPQASEALAEEFAQSSIAASKAQDHAAVSKQPVPQEQAHVQQHQQQQHQQPSREGASKPPASVIDTFAVPSQQPGSARPARLLEGQTTGSHNQTAAAPLQQPGSAASAESHAGSVAVPRDDTRGGESVYTQQPASATSVLPQSGGGSVHSQQPESVTSALPQSGVKGVYSQQPDVAKSGLAQSGSESVLNGQDATPAVSTGIEEAPGIAHKSKAEPLSSWMSFDDQGQSGPPTTALTPAPTPVQGTKQDSWSAAAFADPVDSTSQQHNLQEAGLTDQVLAGSLFGGSPADAPMGQPMNKAETGSQEIVPPVAEAEQQAGPTQEPLQSAPSSWRDLASSSNPFSNPFASPWASLDPTPPGAVPAQPAVQQPDQQLPQPSFDQWNSFGQPPAAATAASRASASHQDAGAPHQQQGPVSGGQGSVDHSWQSFSSPFKSSAQQAQQAPPQHQSTASSDAWGTFNTPQGQDAVAPRVAVIDSWASFDAPISEPQDSRVAYPSVHSQDSWSAFDNLAASRAPGAAAGSQALSPPQQAQHAQQAQQAPQQGVTGRAGSVTELSVEKLGLDPSLQITAQPTADTPRSRRAGDGFVTDNSSDAQGFQGQPPASPQQKPKRGSPVQFGSVFSPGSANSVSKLTGMFKSKSNKLEKDPSLPPKVKRGVPQKGLAVSEVDLWRPQSAEERQQCMDAYDIKGYGRLGGLGEVDARALWSRQNMPAETFQQVWSLSDLDSNQLLSKPEFCLFMYLMHALRNFRGSFHLPEDITPEQATRILGLEGVVGLGSRGPAHQAAPQAAPQASPSPQGGARPALIYPPPPTSSYQQDWEASGGLSPSQTQAVQELSALGFDPRQSQDALEAHTWNKNAAANYLLQGGSSLPPLPALRRSTTDRNSTYSPTAQPGSGSHSRSQSMQQRSGSGRFGHGRTGSLGSGSDFGSGNYTPRSTAGGGEFSQPGSARTTGDSIPGAAFQSGTPRSSTRVPVTENARLALRVARCKMQYKGTMEQPFFTLSIRGRGGSEVEPPQDTPPAYYANGIVSADHPMVVTTPIAQIPQGSVLFFELKHWKPKEKKFSLRGWSLVAVSSLVDYSGPVPQLQTGTIKISMLQKPVDTALNKKHKRLNPEGFDLEVNVGMA